MMIKLTHSIPRSAAWLILLTAAMQPFGFAQEEASADGTGMVDYQMILPEEKEPELVEPGEENPFVAPADSTAKEEAGSSEENTVKERLLSMQVVGFSQRPGGCRVQLGDLTLEENMIVPAFLPDQSVQLRVNSITESEIEFVWLEKQRTGLPPRTLLLPVRIKPVVRQMLPGQRGKVGDLAFGVHAETLLKAANAIKEAAAKRVEDEARQETAAETATLQPAAPARPKSASEAVLDMFFNQGGSLPSPR